MAAAASLWLQLPAPPAAAAVHTLSFPGTIGSSSSLACKKHHSQVPRGSILCSSSSSSGSSSSAASAVTKEQEAVAAAATASQEEEAAAAAVVVPEPEFVSYRDDPNFRWEGFAPNGLLPGVAGERTVGEPCTLWKRKGHQIVYM
uniref:Uncharacterized protein n=1 Tax=Oryza brachyantha TaxID=4533 RepID=J3KY19_ORYBR